MQRFVEIEQRVDTAALDDAPGAARRAAQELARSLPPRARVAVACGSRGIAQIGLLVSAVASGLLSAGLRPFIVPAMGSHGGATAQGQLAVLADHGISEAALGVPLHATQEVRQISSTPDGVSTPRTNEQQCRISNAYETSDQRRLYVPCPHCGWAQTLRWENMVQSIIAKASEPYFTCQNMSCGKRIEEEHKGDLLNQGNWVASLPNRETPGFHIWAAYSKLTTWKNIAEAYKGLPSDLFANDFLGLQHTPNAKGDTF